MFTKIWKGFWYVATRSRYNLLDMCVAGSVFQTLHESESTLLKVFFVALAILILVFRQITIKVSR